MDFLIYKMLLWIHYVRIIKNWNQFNEWKIRINFLKVLEPLLKSCLKTQLKKKLWHNLGFLKYTP